MSNIKTNLIFFLLVIFTTLSVEAKSTIHFFQATADIDIQGDGQTESFKAHIRYNLKDTLWISFTGTLGIEGMRMLVTPDSTYIINKLEKTAYAFSSEEENPFFPFFFQWKDWQQIILNQFDYKDSMLENTYSGDTLLCHLYGAENNSVHSLFKEQLISTIYRHKKTGIQCRLHYLQYENLKLNQSIARSKKIEIIQPNQQTVYISMRYVDYQMNQPKPFPFNFAKYRNGIE